jgi:hypothetical protein
MTFRAFLYTLQFLGIVLFCLIGVKIWTAMRGNEIMRNMYEYRNKVQQGALQEAILKRLTLRIAQSSFGDENNSREMKQLLIKHQLRGTVEVKGKQVAFP